MESWVVEAEFFFSNTLPLAGAAASVLVALVKAHGSTVVSTRQSRS